MFASPIDCSRLRLVLSACVCLLLSLVAHAQKEPAANRYTPPELQASDQEVRNLLTSAESKSDSGDYESAFADAKAALELAKKKGLVGDRAITEDSVAVGYFVLGKVDDALRLYRASLQDAIDSSNIVLQADVLVALSTLPQLQGNLRGALDLLAKARDRADESKNQYIRSRALGELGRVQLLSGELEIGQKSIDEALSIDKVNGYVFEALHTVYAAYSKLAQPQPDLMKAISLLEAARDLGVQKANYLAVVQAENALGAIYVRSGEVQKGIAILEATRNGEVLKDGQTIELPESFRAAALLPFVKTMLLEALAQGYESAKEPDKALETWNELYSLSVVDGFKGAEAEAAGRMAAIYKIKNDVPNALTFFSRSIEAWRSLGNDEQISQSLIGESQLLIQNGKGEEAIPLEEQILDLGEKHHNRQTKFVANVVLAEIYVNNVEQFRAAVRAAANQPLLLQPVNRLQEARTFLEKAQALITPGPGDTEIDPKLVLEVYGRLADIYKSIQLPIKELTELEKAIAVLQKLKDDQPLQQTVAYLRSRLEALKVQEIIANALSDDNPAEALWYSEILYIWNGFPQEPTKDENWNRVLNLPAQVIQRSDGPGALEEMVDQIGPLLGIVELPILNALSNHFLSAEPKPDLAEWYAKQAESVEKLSPNPSDVLLVAPLCQLTIAYAQQRKPELAKQQAVECKQAADRSQDVQSLNLANAAITTAQIATNDLTSALSSLRTFLKASPKDPELHSAVASALAGGKLYQQAVDEFKQAIQLYEATGNTAAAANTWVRMADALATADSQEFKNMRLESLKTAETLYQQAKNLGAEGVAKLAIGSYYSANGDNKTALAYFRDAQQLGSAEDNRPLVAQAFVSTGTAYHSLRDYRNAVEFHRRAAAEEHQLGDPKLEAVALLFVCEDLFSQKQYDSALKVCLDSDSIATHADAPPLNRYWIQGTLSQIYYQQGEIESTVIAAQKAVQFVNQSGDLTQTAYAYMTLSTFYRILGRSEDAATAAEKSLELFQSLNNPQGTVTAYTALVNIYGDRASSVRDFDKAMKYYSEGIKIGPFRSQLDGELVEIYVQTGRFAEAITTSESGYQSCVRSRDTDCQAGWLISLAEAQRKIGNLAASTSSLNQARHLAANSKDFYLQGRLLYGEAGLERARGNLEQAFRFYKVLISLLENVKGQGDPNTQRSVSESYAFIYDEITSTLYAMSAAAKSEAERNRLASLALQYTETNKARQFSDSWGRSFTSALRRALPADLQQKEHSLLVKRDQLRDEGQDLKADPAVEKELESFVEGLRLTHPQYAAVAYPQQVALDSLPVRRDETFVELKVTDESTLIWIARNTGNKVELLDFYQVSKPRQWFEERVGKLRAALNSARPEQIEWRNSEELFTELFPGSFSKTLLESKSIVFVPDDVLSVIPLEMLSPDASKGGFPFLGIPTSYYPSAAALRLSRTAGHVGSWQEAFLGIGDPITSPEDNRYELVGALSSKRGPLPIANENNSEPDVLTVEKIKSRGGLSFERLPGTATEVQEIAKLFESRGQTAELRLGSDATKEKLADTDLTRFRFLHFATHGILPVNSNIKEPALVLSYDGSAPEQMLLSISEILGFKIQADTVVLSACNTGSGTLSRTEGVMSLGRAFMTAGAESVTVSLWQVSDESTQILMDEYYRNLIAGKSKAEALAAARSFLFTKDKRFTNPYYWAPFVLIGD
jgi:hypothetical protein